MRCKTNAVGGSVRLAKEYIMSSRMITGACTEMDVAVGVAALVKR